MLDRLLPQPAGATAQNAKVLQGDRNEERVQHAQTSSMPRPFSFLVLFSELIFMTTLIYLVKQSLSLQSHKDHESSNDIAADVSMAAQYLDDQGGGLAACMVIFCSFLGCFFFILAAGVHINSLGRAKTVSCLLISLVLILPCLKPILGTLNGSKTHALIPSWHKVDPSMRSTVEQCSCILIAGLVILTPIAFDLGATVMNIVGNALVTLCKLAYKAQGHYQTKNKRITVVVGTSTTVHDRIFRVSLFDSDRDRDDPKYQILSKPEHGAPTGDLLMPGSLFRVSDEWGPEWGKMLKLADGRGWAFEIVCSELASSDYVETDFSIEPGTGVSEGSWLLLHESLQQQGDMESEIQMDTTRDVEWHDVRVHSLNPLMCMFEGGTQPHRILAFHHKDKSAPMPWFQFYQLNRMSFILFKSVKDPSSIFLVPTLGYHIFHFVAKLLPVGIQSGGVFGYIVVYMSFINSGATSFMMMGSFGAALVGSMKHTNYTLKFWEDSRSFRFTGAVILFGIMVPSMPLIVFGMVAFVWFFLLLEMVIACLTRVCFPEEFEEIAKITEEAVIELRGAIPELFLCDQAVIEGLKNNTCRCFATFLLLIFWVLSFPCFPLVRTLARKTGIDHEASPLGPLTSVFAVFFFVMLKVLEWQFLFNAATLFLFMDVPYMDAIPLAYLSRHWRCNSCLMETQIARTELSILAWLQFYSMF